mgnify:CR=1 FL=1
MSIPVCCALNLPLGHAPTPTPLYLPGEETAGMNNALFYLLFFIGALLFLLAFFYGRRKG